MSLTSSFIKSRFKKTGFDIGKGGNVNNRIWNGLDEVLENLRDEIEKIEGRTVKGLLSAALLIKGKSQRIVPVDTSNLKAGAYVIWGGGKAGVKQSSGTVSFKGEKGDEALSEYSSVLAERKAKQSIQTDPFAEIGYTAKYALRVHEDLSASHAKKGNVKLFGKNVKALVQVGQAKYLEQPLIQNKQRILDIIAKHAKVKQ